MVLHGRLGTAETMPAEEWERMREAYSSSPEVYEDEEGRLLIYVGDKRALRFGPGASPFQVGRLLGCGSIQEARAYMVQEMGFSQELASLVAEWIRRHGGTGRSSDAKKALPRL